MAAALGPVCTRTCEKSAPSPRPRRAATGGSKISLVRKGGSTRNRPLSFLVGPRNARLTAWFPAACWTFLEPRPDSGVDSRGTGVRVLSAGGNRRFLEHRWKHATLLVLIVFLSP